MIQKPEKWLKPWHMGTHLGVVSESDLMNTNMTGFICTGIWPDQNKIERDPTPAFDIFLSPTHS